MDDERPPRLRSTQLVVFHKILIAAAIVLASGLLVWSARRGQYVMTAACGVAVVALGVYLRYVFRRY